MRQFIRNLIPALLLLLAAGCAKTVPAQQAAAPEASTSDEPAAYTADYAETLFDPSCVHTLDIRTEDSAWDAFIQNCESKEYMRVDLVLDGEYFADAAIRGKGNSSMQRSRATGKYSFKIEFDHYAEGASFHGLDKLGLNNLVVDDSCMRDYITYRMMDAFGVPAPLCSYIFVTVNGEDWGFYLAVEGVEDAFLDRCYGEEHGALYKPDNLNNGGARGGMGGSDDVKLLYIDGDPDSYPNIFDSVKTDISRKDRYRLIESLRKLNASEDIENVVDTEAMLRYLVAHSFVCNGDSYTGSSVHNYYLYEEDGRLSMIPWDYNEAFGDFGSSGAASVVNNPIDSPVTGGALSERPMVAWVFANPTYVARYHALYAELLARFVDGGWLAAEISETRERIAPYVERDPRSYCTAEAFEAGVEKLLLFFDLRGQSVAAQLEGTIPSTAEGQAADPTARIDASALGSASREMGRMPMPGASGNPSGGAS